MKATEMKLTAIMGNTKRDRIRNAHIRGQLRMEDIQNQIKGNRLRWFGHARRTDECRIPERLLELKMTGKRPRGRPQTWWLDQVKRDIERRGQSWRKVEET
jgi:hypothetical protein